MGTSPFPYADYLNSAPSYLPNYQGPSSYNPNWNTQDPAAQMRDNRAYFAATGGSLDNMLGGQQNYASQLEAFYRNPMNAAAGQLATTPGYTSDELSNITRGDQYQKGVTTQDQYNSLGPTDAEYSGMAGNPSSLYGWFDPAYGEQIDQGSAGAQRGVMGQAGSSLGSTLAQQQQGYKAAIDPTALSLDPGYLSSVIQAYGQHSGAIDAATNSPKLDLNLAPQDYLMGDKELQDTVNQAGESVQNARQSQMDNYTRQAQASGNADPMALAALASQTQNQGNEAAANAQTNAYLAARGQQAGRAMNYAQANLGAGQTQAGMQVGAQENLLAQQMGEANTYQQMRLGAAQNLTADQMAAVQAQTGAQMGAAQYLGSTGLGMEQGIGRQAADTQQYNTNTGTQIAGQVNALNTGFQNQQYQNRLGNNMYAQQNTFNQNTGVNDRQAAAYQSAANARIGGNNQFLNWSTGQTGQAVGQNQTAAQQRIGLYGSQAGAINNATAQQGDYDLKKSAQPNWFDKLVGAASGAASAFAAGGA